MAHKSARRDVNSIEPFRTTTKVIVLLFEDRYPFQLSSAILFKERVFERAPLASVGGIVAGLDFVQ